MNGYRKRIISQSCKVESIFLLSSLKQISNIEKSRLRYILELTSQYENLSLLGIPKQKEKFIAPIQKGSKILPNSYALIYIKGKKSIKKIMAYASQANTNPLSTSFIESGTDTVIDATVEYEKCRSLALNQKETIEMLKKIV